MVGILKPSRLRNAVVGVLRSSRPDNGSGTLLLQPRNTRLPQMTVSLDALDMSRQRELRQYAATAHRCCEHELGRLCMPVSCRTASLLYPRHHQMRVASCYIVSFLQLCICSSSRCSSKHLFRAPGGRDASRSDQSSGRWLVRASMDTWAMDERLPVGKVCVFPVEALPHIGRDRVYNLLHLHSLKLPLFCDVVQVTHVLGPVGDLQVERTALLAAEDAPSDDFAPEVRLLTRLCLSCSSHVR